MNDLDLVGVVDENRFPILFTHDFAVQLDRDALRRQGKFFQQFKQINLFRDFFGFAVNNYFHAFDFNNPKPQIPNSKSRLPHDLSQLGFFAVADRTH